MADGSNPANTEAKGIAPEPIGDRGAGRVPISPSETAFRNDYLNSLKSPDALKSQAQARFGEASALGPKLQAQFGSLQLAYADSPTKTLGQAKPADASSPAKSPTEKTSDGLTVVPGNKPNEYTIQMPKDNDALKDTRDKNGRIVKPQYSDLPVHAIKIDGNTFQLRQRGDAYVPEKNDGKQTLDKKAPKQETLGVVLGQDAAAKVTTEKGPDGKTQKITIEPMNEGDIKLHGKEEITILGRKTGKMLEGEVPVVKAVFERKGDQTEITATIKHPNPTRGVEQQKPRYKDIAVFDDLNRWITQGRDLNPQSSKPTKVAERDRPLPRQRMD